MCVCVCVGVRVCVCISYSVHSVSVVSAERTRDPKFPSLTQAECTRAPVKIWANLLYENFCGSKTTNFTVRTNRVNFFEKKILTQ